jgi:hypothetical protein
MNENFVNLDVVMESRDPFGEYPGGGGGGAAAGPGMNDSAVRSFIGQGPSAPHSLPLSARTNSDLIHCSSQTATIGGRSATHFNSGLGFAIYFNYIRRLICI